MPCLDFAVNSPYSTIIKCMEISMENVLLDIMFLRVKGCKDESW